MIRNSRPITIWKRTIAWLTLCFFLLQSVFATGPVSAQSSYLTPVNKTNISFSGLKDTLNNISIPDKFGFITEVFVPDKKVDRLIFVMQDPHNNIKAQYSTAKIYDYLTKKAPQLFPNQAPLVALEGTNVQKKLDYSVLTANPIDKARRAISDFLLNEGKLDGSEYYKANYNPNARLFGIEDISLYNQNVMAFKNAEKKKQRIQFDLPLLRKAIDELKRRAFSYFLKKLDETIKHFEKNPQSIKEHFVSLEGLAKVKNISLSRFSSYQTMKNLIDIENKINKPQLTQELQSLGVFRSPFSFESKQEGRLFVQNLEQMLRQAPAHPKVLNETNKYITYLNSTLSIDADRFFTDLEDIYLLLINAFSESGREKNIAERDRMLRLIEKLWVLEVTDEEYAYFKSHKKTLTDSNYWKVLNQYFKEYLMSYQVEDNFYESVLVLREAENFYESALKRNKELFKNLNQLMKNQNDKTAFLVVGGFHAKELTDYFKDSNTAYALLVPQVGLDQDASLYWRTLAGKNKDLEKAVSYFTTKPGSSFVEGSPTAQSTFMLTESLLSQLAPSTVSAYSAAVSNASKKNIAGRQTMNNGMQFNINGVSVNIITSLVDKKTADRLLKQPSPENVLFKTAHPLEDNSQFLFVSVNTSIEVATTDVVISTDTVNSIIESLDGSLTPIKTEGNIITASNNEGTLFEIAILPTSENSDLREGIKNVSNNYSQVGTVTISIDGTPTSIPIALTSSLDVEVSTANSLGSYTIEHEIGRGAQGVIYALRQGDKSYAMKIFDSSQRDPQKVQREISLQKLLSTSPYVADTFESGSVRDLTVSSDKIQLNPNDLYLIMELVSGQTFEDQFINKQAMHLSYQQFDLSSRLKAILEAAKAIKDVQKRGILHRDVKPSNFILDANGNVKLLDFGLAITKEDLAEFGNQLRTVGTIQTVSPEMLLRGETKALEPSDVYSLGAILYQILTGHPAIKGRSIEEMLVKQHRRLNQDANKGIEILREEWRYQFHSDLVNRAKTQVFIPETIFDSLINLITGLLNATPEGRLNIDEAIEGLEKTIQLIDDAGPEQIKAFPAENITSIQKLVEPKADSLVQTNVDIQSADGFSLGSYTIVKELGRGGMGIVYELQQGDKRFVLKVMKNAQSANERQRTRFINEGKFMQELDESPYIPKIIEYGTLSQLQFEIENIPFEDNDLFIVMELVEGENLEQKYSNPDVSSYDLLDRLETIREAAKAILSTHVKGTIHQDIKAANLMKTASGEVRLLDFGLARKLDTKEREGVAVGTPYYYSPEMIVSDANANSEKSDIYALGVLAYKILTGSLPITGNSLPELAQRIFNKTEEKKQLQVRFPNDPSKVSVLLEKVLSTNFKSDLEDFGLELIIPKEIFERIIHIIQKLMDPEKDDRIDLVSAIKQLDQIITAISDLTIDSPDSVRIQYVDIVTDPRIPLTFIDSQEDAGETLDGVPNYVSVTGNQTAITGETLPPPRQAAAPPIFAADSVEEFVEPGKSFILEETVVANALGTLSVERRLGQGTQGTVFDISNIDRHFALKTNTPGPYEDAEKSRIRFNNESTLLERLKGSPYIPEYITDGKMTDLSFEQELPDNLKETEYLLMELVEGKELIELIFKKEGSGDTSDLYSQFQEYGFKDRLQIMQEFAKGLSYIHSKGIVHLDLKLGNTLLTSDGNVKIIDFGLAQTKEAIRKGSITKEIGSLINISPEMLVGELNAIDEKADIYAWGVNLYFLFTGTAPYGTDFSIMRLYFDDVLNKGKSPISLEDFKEKFLSDMKEFGSIELTIPEEVLNPLVELMYKAVRMRPEERPSTESLIRELGQIIEIINTNNITISVNEIVKPKRVIEKEETFADVDLDFFNIAPLDEKKEAPEKKSDDKFLDSILKRYKARQDRERGSAEHTTFTTLPLLEEEDDFEKFPTSPFEESIFSAQSLGDKRVVTKANVKTSQSIGEGSMGVIDRVELEAPIKTLGTNIPMVAVKRPSNRYLRMLTRELGSRKEALQRATRVFAREAQILKAAEKSPHVVRIYEQNYEVVTDPESSIKWKQPYIAIELLEGGVFLDDKYFANRNVFPNTIKDYESASLFTRVFDMLAIAKAVQNYQAQTGQINNDFKLENFYIDTYGTVRLFDLGLAITQEETQTLPENTRRGSIAYNSPEMAAGNIREVSQKSDMFSLGVVFHHLLTGKLPFDLIGLSKDQAKKKIAGIQPQDIQSLDQSLKESGVADFSFPQRLQDAITTLLSPNPKNRSAARQLEKRLERIVSDMMKEQLEQALNAILSRTTNETININEFRGLQAMSLSLRKLSQKNELNRERFGTVFENYLKNVRSDLARKFEIDVNLSLDVIPESLVDLFYVALSGNPLANYSILQDLDKKLEAEIVRWEILYALNYALESKGLQPISSSEFEAFYTEAEDLKDIFEKIDLSVLGEAQLQEKEWEVEEMKIEELEDLDELDSSDEVAETGIEGLDEFQEMLTDFLSGLDYSENSINKDLVRFLFQQFGYQITGTPISRAALVELASPALAPAMLEKAVKTLLNKIFPLQVKDLNWSDDFYESLKISPIDYNEPYEEYKKILKNKLTDTLRTLFTQLSRDSPERAQQIFAKQRMAKLNNVLEPFIRVSFNGFNFFEFDRVKIYETDRLLDEVIQAQSLGQMANLYQAPPQLTAFESFNPQDPAEIRNALEEVGFAPEFLSEQINEIQVQAESLGAVKAKVLRSLGVGGFGAVYLVERADGQLLAIKQLIEQTNPYNVDLFKKEKENHSYLTSQAGIQSIPRYVAENGNSYAMEFIEGKPLNLITENQLLFVGKQDAKLTMLKDLLDIFGVKAATALFELHSKAKHPDKGEGVHRDIKPANLIMDIDGNVVVIDLGLFKWSSEIKEEEIIYGTPEFMAPELIGQTTQDLWNAGLINIDQIDEYQQYIRKESQRSDIYALGVSLYQALTGRLPYEIDFTQKNEFDGIATTMLRQKLKYERPSLILERRGVSLPKELTERLDTIVDQALNANPLNRYASLDLMAQDVSQLIKAIATWQTTLDESTGVGQAASSATTPTGRGQTLRVNVPGFQRTQALASPISSRISNVNELMNEYRNRTRISASSLGAQVYTLLSGIDIEELPTGLQPLPLNSLDNKIPVTLSEWVMRAILGEFETPNAFIEDYFNNILPSIKTELNMNAPTSFPTTIQANVIDVNKAAQQIMDGVTNYKGDRVGTVFMPLNEDLVKRFETAETNQIYNSDRAALFFLIGNRQKANRLNKAYPNLFQRKRMGFVFYPKIAQIDASQGLSSLNEYDVQNLINQRAAQFIRPMLRKAGLSNLSPENVALVSSEFKSDLGEDVKRLKYNSDKFSKDEEYAAAHAMASAYLALGLETDGLFEKDSDGSFTLSESVLTGLIQLMKAKRLVAVMA